MDNFYNICMNGDIKEVLEAIKKGADEWNMGLIAACYGGNRGPTHTLTCGHMDIVKLMIEKGANEWNNGLYEACKGGCPKSSHLDIVKLMIEKGSKETAHEYSFRKNIWDYGLKGSFRGDCADITKLMIENGASVKDEYIYPGSHDSIMALLEAGLPINKLRKIVGYDKLTITLTQFKETSYNELYQYMPKELSNIVTEYCLL